jgi:hypothetical protein
MEQCKGFFVSHAQYYLSRFAANTSHCSPSIVALQFNGVDFKSVKQIQQNADVALYGCISLCLRTNRMSFICCHQIKSNQ